jgi:hypothetical protein
MLHRSHARRTACVSVASARPALLVLILSLIAPSAAWAQITGQSWRSLGPTNFGGPVTGILIDPADSNKLLVSTDGGGLWRSADGGASWKVMDDVLPTLRGAMLARNPVQPNVLYAGTSAGLFRSSDGGASWSRVTALPAQSISSVTVGSLGQLILVTSASLYRSIDGGETWQDTQQWTGNVAISPSDNQFVVKTTLSESGAGISYSRDGGVTWTPVDCSLTCPDYWSRVQFAPSNPDVLYLAGDSYPHGFDTYLYRIVDASHLGQSSTIERFRIGSGGHGDAGALWVDPTNSNVVVVGKPELWRSMDGGTTFTQLTDPWLAPSLPGGNARIVVADPGFNGTTNRRVYVGTNAGLFRTDDIYAATPTSGWVSLNDGLVAARLADVAVSANGTTLAVTENHDVLRLPNGSTAATRVWGRDEMDVPRVDHVAADAQDERFVYLFTDALGSPSTYLRSSNNGFTFSPVAGPRDPDGTALRLASGYLDPSNGGALTFLANRINSWVYRLFQSTDARSDTPTWQSEEDSWVSTSSAIVAANGSTAWVWWGPPKSSWAGVIAYSLATTTPTRKSSFTALGEVYTIATPDGQIGYATEHDRGFRTVDGGRTWTPIAPVTGYVASLTAHPRNSNWVFAATREGVYLSTNAGHSWTFAFPNRAAVTSFAWHGDTLVAATAGRGLWAVDVPNPTSLMASPWALRFGATTAGTTGNLASVTAAQHVAVVTVPDRTLAWSAASDQSWLRVTNGSGTGNGQFTVSVVNDASLVGTATTLTATISLTATDPDTSPVTIPVTLTIAQVGTTGAPFGAFDLPAGNTTLSGSFAVTGWALDDVGIDRVEIWRDPVAGETTPTYYGPGQPGHGKIFIANPFFVAGSRPDVEAAYPNSPGAYRAGWGYLLLSHGLGNGGNGTYKLYAYAFDLEGNWTLLGTKTITVDNAHAAKPFGAIDTPGYGATVSGGIWNYGWVLTPASAEGCTITDGNVLVSIDSGPLVPVHYGDVRTDVAAAFPGLTNSAAAGGSYYIDTTQLSNGTHTIGWLVYDSCGRGDGIGSRFFTVLNGSGDQAATALANLQVRPAGVGLANPAEYARASERRARLGTPDAVGRGFSPAESVRARQLGGDWEAVAQDATGTHVIHVDRTGHVEVQLPALATGEYTAFREVQGERRALPLGSSLDARKGIFYWQPAPGLFGAYDLVFAPSVPTAAAVHIRVIVGSQKS